MNKRFALAFALLLGASLSFAQATGGSNSKTAPDSRKAAGKATSEQSKVALNPQPLPPGERKAGGDPASKVSLNPQPLPPKQGKVGSTSAASKVSLNPQPLPPGERKAGGDPASKVSLNPQPLPPKVGSSATQKTSISNKAGKKIMTPGAGAKQ
ncbi:MAG TPA: hypothetical protein VIK39_07830 [Candidatus Angelobacter sp.]